MHSTHYTGPRSDGFVEDYHGIHVIFAADVLAGITVFLGFQAIPVLQTQGLSFLTTSIWDPPD